jgi:hypothetical protein
MLDALVMVLGLVTCLGCADSPATGQQMRAVGLVVLSGALDVRETEENEGALVHELEEEYPAEDTIQSVGVSAPKGACDGS